MSKILFFNIPAYGHMNPTLPLVAELVRRGEQVIYYSSETFQPAIEQAGAAFRSISIFFNEQTPVDENLMRFAYTLIQATQEIIADILPVALGTTFRQSGGPKLAVDEIEGFKRKHGI